MKTFTQIALSATFFAIPVIANAQSWESFVQTKGQKLVDTYENLSVSADFSGNNRLDLYHTGAYSTEWCTPFNFRIGNGCEVISSLIINNTDGSVTLDWNVSLRLKTYFRKNRSCLNLLKNRKNRKNNDEQRRSGSNRPILQRTQHQFQVTVG